jgi:hypothetical protein
MFCDAYQRLTMYNCEREALQSQLKLLSDALGPLKPPPISVDSVDLHLGMVYSGYSSIFPTAFLCLDDEDVLGLSAFVGSDNPLKGFSLIGSQNICFNLIAFFFRLAALCSPDGCMFIN